METRIGSAGLDCRKVLQPGGALLLLVLLGWPGAVRAAETTEDIFGLDLEELVQLEITSVSKRAERASEAAAAVYVLTGEEIRRSGATSLPEALRGVPGLHVAQNSGGHWAVSSRGFASLLQDKLLVLLDGRSVYSPLFAGVNWDVQDVLLEDIDRVEVIRGPGGTLWGSNAVNGVINLLTKPASESQGTYASGGGGTLERAFAEARRGGTLGQRGHWRAYGKYRYRTGLKDTGTTTIDDPMDQVRGGFRGDLDLGSGSRLTIQGDAYHGHSPAPGLQANLATLQTIPVRIDGDVLGGNLLTRWTRQRSEHSETSVQMYYDLTDRDDSFYDYHRGTFDLEAQHRFTLLERADLTWGAGYRMYRDDIDGTPRLTLIPERRSYDLLSGFVHSELRFLDDQLRLTLGTKLERNDFSGLEHQPNLRLAFVPGPGLTIWSAVSRAVRTPHRASEDSQVLIAGVLPPTSPLPTEVVVTRTDDVRSEDLVAYELGVRARLADGIWLDLAGFYHQYDNVTATGNARLVCTDGTPITGAASITACALGGNRLRQYIVIANRVEAQSKGVEAALRFQISDRWQLDLGYSYFHIGVDAENASTAAIVVAAEEQSPEHQLSLRSRMNPHPDWTLDAGLFWVDELRALGVDAYVRLDVRVAWQVTDRLELSLVGQNLVDEHQEIAGQFLAPSKRVPRSAFAALTWRY